MPILSFLQFDSQSFRLGRIIEIMILRESDAGKFFDVLFWQPNKNILLDEDVQKINFRNKWKEYNKEYGVTQNKISESSNICLNIEFKLFKLLFFEIKIGEKAIFTTTKIFYSFSSRKLLRMGVLLK